MSSIVLSGIYIYPVKSLGGIALQEATIQERGLQYDRRWMLVDQHNHFMTQRKIHRMALIKVKLAKDKLLVSMPSMPDLAVPFVPQTEESVVVTVWEDVCRGIIVSRQANEWFSEALQMPCKLVYMPDDSIRPVDFRYARNNEFVSFADAYPFLLIGEASLEDLNSRLDKAVPMNRFRPNLVVNTSIAFEEDNWRSIRIGEALFHLVKPCARCVLTTIDQQTGVAGKEPLRTLSAYRTINNKVLFGQNAVSVSAGLSVKLGDKVQIVQSTINSIA